MFGQPSLLWRMLLLELWKQLVVCTAALALLVAFAAMVKPLGDGALTPLTAVKFMCLALVPMLQFALPFGAALASTLAYHRFASEQEACAAWAGGLSHRRLLFPAFVTGVVVASLTGALTTRVIPRFFMQMEQLLAANVADDVISGLQDGGEFEYPSQGLVIAADMAVRAPQAPQPGVREYLLEHMVLLTHDDAGVVRQTITASVAQLFFRTRSDPGVAPQQTMMIVLSDATSEGIDEDGGFSSLRYDTVDYGPFLLPSFFRKDPKFYTSSELRALHRNPDPLDTVDSYRRRLAADLSSRALRSSAVSEVRQTGALRLLGPDSTEFAFRAVSLEESPDGRLFARSEAPGSVVRLSWRKPSESSPTWHAADSLSLVVTPSPETGDCSLGFVCEGFTRDGLPGERARFSRVGLRLAADPVPAVSGASSASLLASTDLDRAESGPVPRSPSALEARASLLGAASDLRESRRRARSEIVGTRHERLAFAFASLLAPLTAGVLSLLLGSRMPLPVYLCSFFPSLLCLIVISAGRGASKSSMLLGLPLMWGGVLLLAAYTYLAYRRLCRH